MTDEWSDEAVRMRMAARKRAYVIRSHEAEAAAFERAADNATGDGRAHLQKVAARYRQLADMARHRPDTYPDDLENWFPMTATTGPRTARPEGFVARYLTVAGEALRDPSLSVTITETGPRDSEYLYMTVAHCAGCGDSDRTGWPDGTYGYNDKFTPTPREQAIAWAEQTARTWAQAHAEKCRAMSRPSGD